MNIEEQKKNFLDLLRSEYKAKQARWNEKGYESILDGSYFGASLNDYEQGNRLKISEDILKKYGFEGSDFWEILCPLLKQERYIEAFGDPNDIPSEYFSKLDSSYEKLKAERRELYDLLPPSYLRAKDAFEEELATGGTGNVIMTEEEKYRFGKLEEGINIVDKKINNIEKFARNSYPFFEVNKKKLFNKTLGVDKDKKYPSSIHLVSTSVAAKTVIWLVFNELWDMPIRYLVTNTNGEPTAIKKLYDIAYPWDVQGNRIEYKPSVAKSINNDLFKKQAVLRFMKTNNLDKPTLVTKSKESTLVLKNDIPVKTILVNKVQSQSQSLYIDKTK